VAATTTTTTTIVREVHLHEPKQRISKLSTYLTMNTAYSSGVLFHGGGLLDGGVGRHRNMLECSWTALEFLNHDRYILLDQFLDNDLIDTHGTSNIVEFVLMLSCVSGYLAAVLSIIYLLVQKIRFRSMMKRDTMERWLVIL